MKVNPFKNNQKRLLVLLLCSGFIAVSYPSEIMAKNNSITTTQQTKQVSGKVTDVNGEPIIGASVLEKGTTNGVITNLDGEFSLTVQSKTVLEISYIGYKTQTVNASPGKMVQVTMSEDMETLDEVVVVGYGVQKKSDVTGSVTSVSKDRLSKLPVTNVLQAIQGATAGVTITQTSSIPGDAPDALVRGQNSINANSGPYIVVDGVPISKSGGTLNDINPNDIESMEILKDASATAIYGTNGANGVILITTKRGKSNEQPSIRYNMYVGVEDFSHKLKMDNGTQILKRYKDHVDQNPGESLANGFVRNLNEIENYEKGYETDWIDAISQTGIIQDHNVSIGGGANNVQYYISADYMSQKGVVKGYNYKRYSIRTNIDVNVTNYLKIGTNSYIVSHNRDGGRANLLMAEAMSPYGKMYEDDGSYCIHPMSTDKLYTNPLMWTTTNPERRQWNINLNGYAEVDFEKIWLPLKGLRYKFNGGFAYMPKRYNSYKGKSVNDLTGTAEIKNEETQSYTIENIVTYTRDFNKHHLDLTGLYASSRKKYQLAQAMASNFPSDEQLWHNIGSASTPQVNSYTDLYATVSQMGRLNYSYDSRYLFTFTVRRDGSSVFGDNNKYGVFPSVALGWNLTNESFMEPIQKWMNSLKLRLSYGNSGNEAIGVYQSRMKMINKMLSMNGSSNLALYPDALMGNSDLGWEVTKTFNVGLDFGLWNNRLTGNVDAYFSRTNNLLMQRNLPTISGYNKVYQNMGETANKGIEITLNSRNIVTSDFTWSTNLVFSWNKNEIKDLYGDGKDDIANRWFIGQPIGVIYDYTKVGIWQEDEIAAGAHEKWDPMAKAGDLKLADLNKDGKISDEDRSVLGQTTPKWIGGMTNTFTWKDLTLSVFLQSVQGVMKNNTLIGTQGDELGRRNMASEIGYWTPENQSTEWRALRKDSNPHMYGFPCKANYIRIKDITLSYNFAGNIVKKMGIGGLTVYASGRNLFTFTNWIGWDPEVRQVLRGNTSWDATRGETVYDSSNYPMTKSYVFGLNLTF